MRLTISRIRPNATLLLLMLAASVGVLAQGKTGPAKPATGATSIAAPSVDAPPAVAAPVKVAPAQTGGYRLGEKLRYNISYGRFINAAYAETFVASHGNLSGRDAIELQSRIKTIDLVNAAVLQLDETRRVYVAPDTGLPLFTTRRDNGGMAPRESSVNYLSGGAAMFDLLSLIYKMREVGGTGTFTLFEDEKTYTVTFQAGKSERVLTEAGTFDTVICDVASDYLTARGIKELKINLTSDADHVPVLFRMRTLKGDVRASIATIELPPATVTAPVAITTPTPQPTVRPKPTATPYINNQPLAAELGFELGETLEYNITLKGSVQIARIALSARERKLFQNDDSLLLTATVIKADPSYKAFVAGDALNLYVDPETLVPRYMEARFTGDLNWMNQVVAFDRKTGAFSLNGAPAQEAPMGTHTILSLLYAMRSFNLKPSKDPTNPVNDTRVAVFWDKRPYIFTLRPSPPETIVINGQKVTAQLVKMSTGEPSIDSAAPQVWLSTDTRIPVRFSAGPYQAELVSQSKASL